MTGCLLSWGGPMQGLQSSVLENWAGVKEIPTKCFTYGIQVPNALRVNSSTFCDGNRLTQYLLSFFQMVHQLTWRGQQTNGWRTWIPGRAKWTQTHLSSVDGMQSYLLKTQPLQIMRVSSEPWLSFFHTALSTIHILASLFSQNPNHSVSGLPLLEIFLSLSLEKTLIPLQKSHT